MNLNQNDWSKNKDNDPESIIIDVRTQEEYDEGHIRKSILVDINQPSLFMESILKLKKNKSYFTKNNLFLLYGENLGLKKDIRV